MGVLNALKSWIAPTPALREERAARRVLEKHTKHLETELLRRYEESLEISARPILPWERLYDGEKLLFPAGFPQDRQAGRNRPMLETDQGLRGMRAFSRLLCDTNLVCLGFRDHITNFVVGKGYEWQVVLRGQKSGPTSAGLTDEDGDGQPDVDPDTEACQQVLDEFKRQHGWGESGDTIVQMDQNDDESPVGNTEREAYQRAMADGECFVRLFRGGSETNGIPRMRFVEPECIMTPPGSAITSPWGWGILTDEQDSVCRKAYHIVPTDQYGTEGEIVPASRVVHFKLNTVSSVKRGIPDFWPLADEATGVRTLVRNVLDVSGILAAIAYIREHAPTTTSDQVRTMIGNSASGIDTINRVTPGSYGVENNAGPDRTSYLNMHRVGTIIDVSNQLRYTPGPVNTGIPGFIQAEQATLRMIGLRWGCPEYFSGDSSNANFASTLVSGGPFERSAAARQQDYGMFSAKLAARVLAMAIESGRLRAEQVRRVAVRIVVPPVVISNKDADTSRRRTLFDAKVLSPQTWATEEGYDPAVEAANIKAWAEQFPDDAGGGMGGLFGGGDDGGDGGTGGGDDFASLFGESRITEDMPDGYTREGVAYFLEARSGLIKKTITNKRGHKQTVYVRAGDNSTAADQSTQARADSRTAVAMAIGQTNRLTMSQMHRLADHIGELTRDEIREHLRTLGEKIGGEKRKIAERLVERIRAEHGKSEPYVQPRPEPKEPTANAVDGNRERGNNPGVGTQSETPKPGDGKMPDTKAKKPKIKATRLPKYYPQGGWTVNIDGKDYGIPGVKDKDEAIRVALTKLQEPKKTELPKVEPPKDDDERIRVTIDAFREAGITASEEWGPNEMPTGMVQVIMTDSTTGNRVVRLVHFATPEEAKAMASGMRTEMGSKQQQTQDRIRGERIANSE